jgi:dipeptidyl aminopeptidase/acylaminoacyl peptidase
MRILCLLFLASALLGACKRSPAKSKTEPGSRASETASIAPAATPAGTAAAAAPATEPSPKASEPALAVLHRHYRTKTTRAREPVSAPPPEPPGEAKLARVKYRSPVGDMWAYLTPDPGDGKKHPAVVWSHGGFDFGIDEGCFTPGSAENDQSGAQLRTGGIVVMYPSFRGTHDNPGVPELLYGEVDDFLAAADHLRTLSYVDPDRIYLAGHSTGGALVLLAAAMTDRFRAAFAFGPVDRVERYGPQHATFDPQGPDAEAEWRVRAPIRYLGDIRRPTVVIDGARSPNAQLFPSLEAAAKKGNAPVTVITVPDKDHFSVLAPQLQIVAQKIVADTGTGDFRW